VTSGGSTRDHGDPGDAPTVPPPLTPPVNAVRPSAAEEARTIAASTNTGTLASLTSEGDPWASFVTYGLLGGAPVLCVSNLAEHGRNLAGDRRASIAIVAPSSETDPLASGRITLAGHVAEPEGAERAAAREAHLSAVAAAKYYIDYSDFSLWVLRVERVRWVGGYGRMDSTSGREYAEAQADPVTPVSAGAVAHLNDDHAESLVTMARTLGGYPDTTAAVCTGADRYGLDLRLTTDRGMAYTRIGYAEPIDSVDELRSAAVELVRRARQVDSGRGGEPRCNTIAGMTAEPSSADRPDTWQAAFDLIRTRGHERRDEPFRLASGQLSHDYIDGKYAVDTGERLAVVSRAVADLAAANGIEFDAVGGLTMGADPLAHGVAMVTGKAWFSVRKEQKSRGREQWIEGTRLQPGTRVLLVDDVISTGGSTEIALDRVKAVGAVATGVIPMVDRGDVAARRFAQHGVPFHALVTYRDLGIEPVHDV